MGDVELPEAPDEGQPPEKKGLLGRVQEDIVGAVKQAQASRTEIKVGAAQAQAGIQ